MRFNSLLRVSSFSPHLFGLGSGRKVRNAEIRVIPFSLSTGQKRLIQTRLLLAIRQRKMNSFEASRGVLRFLAFINGSNRAASHCCQRYFSRFC